MTMDYSPWVEREIWPFLELVVSPKLKRPHPPKLVYMHVTLTHICMNFLNRFRSIKFFDDHGIVHGSKGKFGRFWEVAVSPKLERPHPPKLVYMHVTLTHICMNFLS